LTHSLEVSVVGRFRTFGWKENNWEISVFEVHGFHMNDFGAIVARPLAHDIGNPPLDIQVKKR
jgi:dGTP triphosphohydrolase